MTKMAMFADIHGNLEALSACLAHARALGADRLAFLGDLIGYGADPVAVLDLIESHAHHGAVVVLGNHDAAALGRTTDLNPSAQTAIAWTRARLGASQLSFLQALPLVVKEDNMLFVHASAAAPERWIYITSPAQADASIRAAGTSYVFCGHVHEQQLYFRGAHGRPTLFHPVPDTPIPAARQRQWLAIVGSTGQPRDRNTAASYALFDSERERLTFYRVPYDHRGAATKVRAAGLPERLALRLERGS
jgi:diadenosine tetraphosphatase ApaH/serine/threonine PP2A family protein phosphatase